MESHFVETYLLEAATQCEFALNAVRGLNGVLQRLSQAAQPTPDTAAMVNFEIRMRMHQEVFRSIHSFLTHASNVSRLFWPAPPRRQRGEGRPAYRERCATTPRLERGA